MKTIGVISDTHGLLRPEAIEALQGSEHIIHAGDIGKQSIIDTLSDIAPVTAVWGNVDKGELKERYAYDEVLEVEQSLIYVTHILEDLNLDPAAAKFQVVITGHSHKPKTETIDGVLYLNPGSAGPRRFSLPVSVARLEVDGSDVAAEIIELKI